MRDRKARAMVVTWSDEESDSSTKSEEEGRDNLCLMAHGKEVEEVSLEEENSFSIDELELAYSHLLEKYRRMKHDNKDLKKKIKTYAYDSTPCSECSLLEKEIEKLNDKHTSLNIESEKLKSHAS